MRSPREATPIGPLSRLPASLSVAILSAMLAGCTGGSGDEGSVDMGPKASAAAEAGSTKDARDRARRIAAETSGKAR